MTDHLQHFPDGSHSFATWTLLQEGAVPVLPCAVPFGATACDLAPAIQSLEQNEPGMAVRFVELQLAAIPTTHADHWPLSLILGMLHVEHQHGNSAWRVLQTALTCRSSLKRGSVPAGNFTSTVVQASLAMATIALSVRKLTTAEQCASDAVRVIQQNPMAFGAEVLQDVRADAMTVFAAIRLAQRRYHEAETLLEPAHDAHRQAGDIQQCVVDLILMADVEYHSGSLLSACSLLYDGERILTEDFDPARHWRHRRLNLAVRQRLRRYRMASTTSISRLSWN
ncbi:MAG: hypothetical protein R3C59_19550 [Planctomycetaceae bacterium]